MPRRKRLPQQIDAHIYLDKELMSWVQTKAYQNGRTFTGEIRWRLEQQRQAERQAAVVA